MDLYAIIVLLCCPLDMKVPIILDLVGWMMLF